MRTKDFPMTVYIAYDSQEELFVTTSAGEQARHGQVKPVGKYELAEIGAVAFEPTFTAEPTP